MPARTLEGKKAWIGFLIFVFIGVLLLSVWGYKTSLFAGMLLSASITLNFILGGVIVAYQRAIGEHIDQNPML